MNNYDGSIFSGEIDQKSESFYLTGVKSLTTGSELSLEQLNELHNYLNKQRDSCMLTVNDQIPVLLQKHEVNSLLGDIDSIVKSLNTKEVEGSN